MMITSGAATHVTLAHSARLTMTLLHNTLLLLAIHQSVMHYSQNDHVTGTTTTVACENRNTVTISYYYTSSTGVLCIF